MNQKGFTLMEMLAVILIIAILTAVALPQYRNVVEKGRVAGVTAMLRAIYDSSERLAGEFGYRSYEALIRAKGNESQYSFPRLDMGNICEIKRSNGVDNVLLHCPDFDYRISQKGFVTARKHRGVHQGTYILLNRSTMELFCQPNFTNDPNGKACDVYGLDVLNAGIADSTGVLEQVAVFEP